MSDVAYLRPRKGRSNGDDKGDRPVLRKLLGEVLRRIRLRQRRTLADVARKAAISMPYLSEVERGRKEASSEVLAALCDALRVDLSDVLAEVGRDLVKGRIPTVRLEMPPAIPLESVRRRRGVPPPARRPGEIVLLAA